MMSPLAQSLDGISERLELFVGTIDGSGHTTQSDTGRVCMSSSHAHSYSTDIRKPSFSLPAKPHQRSLSFAPSYVASVVHEQRRDRRGRDAETDGV